MSSYVNILVFCLFVIQTNGLDEGEICFKNGIKGVCRNINKCQSARNYIINNRRYPQLCSFLKTDPVVCCLENTEIKTKTARVPVHTTKRISTTTEYIPELPDYVAIDTNPQSNDDDDDKCVNDPIPSNWTALKTGQKAWDKCVEYQQKLIFPCERAVTHTRAFRRLTKCQHGANELIVGGVHTNKDEFPHMVLLGYGQDANSLQWLCGGSLISERFILTAGHCTSDRDIGPVTHVRVGALRRTDPLSPSQLYLISDIIKHPQYHSPRQYNDIALLKTDRDVILDEFTVPACLDVGAPGDYSRLVATGWGTTKNRGNYADHLQKVTINKFTASECSKMIRPTRHLKQGFNVDTQICYGDKNESKDTCQGDSGGPLQLKSDQLYCMYTVVGVTSIGRKCGYIGEPGIYTRVAAFVPWIESIVWP